MNCLCGCVQQNLTYKKRVELAHTASSVNPWSTLSFLSTWFIKQWERQVAAAAAKSLQSCPTLCDPIDGSPPGSPVPGILQARTLQWVAISFPNAQKWKVKVKSPSHVRPWATPWTAVHQAPLSMGFSRQEYWSGVPLPSLRDRLGLSILLCFKNIFPCMFWFLSIFRVLSSVFDTKSS